MLRREEREQVGARGEEAGRPRPYGRSGTTRHVRRVGSLEGDSSWDRIYLACVPTACAQMIGTDTRRKGPAACVHIQVHTQECVDAEHSETV